MPPTYRGENNDIEFINDAQNMKSLQSLEATFKTWVDLYQPCPLYFQIGYVDDEKWWNKYDNPVHYVSNYLCNNLKTKNQQLGIVWVNFSLTHEKVDKYLNKTIWE